jgi:hypothetical protein
MVVWAWTSLRVAAKHAIEPHLIVIQHLHSGEVIIEVRQAQGGLRVAAPWMWLDGSGRVSGDSGRSEAASSAAAGGEAARITPMMQQGFFAMKIEANSRDLHCAYTSIRRQSKSPRNFLGLDFRRARPFHVRSRLHRFCAANRVHKTASATEPAKKAAKRRGT